MAELKIRVGASVDRSLSLAYQPLIEAANKAAGAVARAGAKGGQALATTTKQGTSSAEKEYAKLARSAERWQRDMVRSAEKASRDEVRSAEKAARDKTRAAERATQARQRENDKIVRDVERSERAATAAAEREASARTRANERAMKAAARQNASEANRYGGYAIGAAKRAVGAGLGFAKTVAGGMGVNLDMGSLMTKGTELEKNAVDLSNQAFFSGKSGAAGQRQDPKVLAEEVRKVAMSTGNDSGDTMGGLQAFVAKTGDLESGRAILFDLSKLAKATGTNMQDMVDAAGDVANALGDVPNKGAAIKSVMTAIAAQGKEGAVEIKSLATQMAKLGAASTQFTGSSEQSMANMGALVQMTRAKGGAASSTQAATSVGSFVSTFSKGARRKAFDAAGVQVEAADGKLRNPRDIIIDALKATKGDTVGMGKMFMDVAARRVTRGFETTYKEAGGGAAGIKAVEQAFNDLARATMLQTEIEESFARAMQTSDAKAKVFNEQLGKVATELQAALLPALQGMAPLLVSMTGSVATFIGKVTGATEAKRRTDDVGVDTRAANAAGTVHQILRTGRTVDGETEEAAKARDALKATVERRKKELAEKGDFSARTGDGAWARITKVKDMTDDELAFAAKNNDEAAGYVNDKKALESMQATLSDLDSSLQLAMTRALEGSVITVRLNDPLQIATPSILNTPVGGVEPAPGAKKK